MKTFSKAAGALALLALAAFASQAQTLSRLTITPSPGFVVTAGPPIQLHAIATYTDGTTQDVSAQAAWTSDTPAVATISPTGAATGVASGISTMMAVFNGRSAVSLLNVETFSPSLPTRIATLALGVNPVAVAVNQVTGKVYVANSGTNNVSVIDPATYTTTLIPAGTAPSAIAVNAITNRIYVANSGSNDVTVIDGATNLTTTVAAGIAPLAIAVNPATNRIYIANSSSLTIIDGQANNSTTIPTASGIESLAINPVTNRIYIGFLIGGPGVLVFDGDTNSQLAAIPLPANFLPTNLVVNPTANQIYVGSALVVLFTVIDGATNTITQPQTVTSGAGPIAVNPVLNVAIVANNNVSVFDAATGSAFSVFSATNPSPYRAIAINPVTNQAYLVSPRTNTVGVLDGPNGYAMTTSITVGASPGPLAIDTVRNKIYVVNQGDNTLSVIDGASNTPGPLGTGLTPQAVAVNLLTNKIYVANMRSNDVTVIDGVTSAVNTIPAGTAPLALAVDALANKIYVANSGSANVTVIDGATDVASTVPVGAHPVAVAVNDQTGIAYVANSGDGTVTAIDGATAATATIPVGTIAAPAAAFFTIGVNQKTNQIYVPLPGSGAVAVIDGITNNPVVIAIGGAPNAVAVNTATNRAYVTNTTGNVTVIDGFTNLLTTVNVGFNMLHVVANPFTNRIYTLGAGGNGGVIASINGATNDFKIVPLPLSVATSVLALDPVTDKIYAGSIGGSKNDGVISLDGAADSALLTGDDAATPLVRATALAVNPASNRVYAVSPLAGTPGAVIAEENVQQSSLRVAIHPSPGDRTSSYTPTIVLSANADAIVYFQFDTRAGNWFTAVPNADGTFSATPQSPLEPGLHVVLAFAADAHGPSGAIASYPFFVAPGRVIGPVLTSISVNGASTHAIVGALVSLTAIGIFSDGSQRDITAEVAWTSSNSTVAINATGVATAVSAGSAIVTASEKGISGTSLITVDNPTPAVALMQTTSSVPKVGWVAQVTLKNIGNVAIANVQETKALLNGIAQLMPVPSIAGNLAPGGSVSFAVSFPASAAPPASRASLSLQGAYTAILPNGSTQPGSFSSGFRIVLP